MIMNNPTIEERFPFECSTTHSYTEVVPWLEDNFGKFNDRWYRYGTDLAMGLGYAHLQVYDYYRFRDDMDAVLFKLRWS